MRALSVAEKPSVAKSLVQVLGGGRRRQSHDQYSAFFDLDRVALRLDGRMQQVEMVVTSVRGHVYAQDFDAQYRKWSSCSPGALFQDAAVHKYVPEDHAGLQRNLRQEAARCQILVLWLDCDREGENIAFEVRDICLAVNPRMRVLRARFSAVTAQDVANALNNLQPPNAHQADAVDARQEIDLRLGAAFTRFQTLLLQNRFAALVDALVSYGPCQFPCLGFVAARQANIDAFRSQTFWSLRLSRAAPPPAMTFNWSRHRVFDRVAALLLLEVCLRGGDAVVVSVRGGKKTKARPLPLQTIKLQQLASRCLHISPDRTMDQAEKLYQKGVLSYPRTETEVFNRTIDLETLVRHQSGSPRWGAYATGLLETPAPGGNGFLWPRDDSTKNDEAHPPIHPVRFASDNEFDNDDQKRIYELVTRHFLACCSRDAEGVDSVVEVEMGGYLLREGGEDSEDEEGDAQEGEGGLRPRKKCWSPAEEAAARQTGDWVSGEIFDARGLQVLARNWLEVYPYERWSGHTLPAMQMGDRFVPSELQLVEGHTTPPLPLSEEQLLGLMERHGIGTDATMADHIKTVQERNYIKKRPDRRFLPTPLGVALLEGYKAMGVAGMGMPNLRAAMERDCAEVAAGRMSKAAMVERCTTEMKGIFDLASKRADLLRQAVGRRLAALGLEEDQDEPEQHGQDGGGGGGGGGGAGSGMPQNGGGGDGASNDGGEGGRRRRREGDENAPPRPPRLSTSGFKVLKRKFSRCGKCARHLELRESSRGPSRAGAKNPMQYLFCKGCKAGYPLPAFGKAEAFDHSCPICDFQIVQIGPGRGSEKSAVYPLCPHCYSCVPRERGRHGRGPDLGDLEDLIAGPLGVDDEETQGAESPSSSNVVPGPPASLSARTESSIPPVLSHFSCAQCAHPTCRLASYQGAGSASALSPCPACSTGTLSLGSHAGRFKASCDRWSHCKTTFWFRGAVSAEVGDACGSCARKRVRLHLDVETALRCLAQLDNHDMDLRRITGCLKCDLRTWTDLQLASVPAQPRKTKPALPGPAPAAKRSRPGPPSVGPSAATRCQCGESPRAAVSQSANNPNRPYLRCATGKCDFFEWQDSARADDAAGILAPPREAGLTCFKCQQPGHFASQCPQGAPNGTTGAVSRSVDPGNGSRGGSCFTCGQPGHFAQDCPTQSGGRADGRCYKCGLPGHFASRCPAAGSGGAGGAGVVCFRCKQPGHMSDTCPQRG